MSCPFDSFYLWKLTQVPDDLPRQVPSSAMRDQGSKFFDFLLWGVALALLGIALWPRASGPVEGSRAPLVKVAELEGHGLHALKPKGKPLLVAAFASWCGACRRSNGSLDAIHRLADRAGLEVVAVSVDRDIDDARRAKAEWPIEAPVFFDARGAFASAYSIDVLPTYILIDKDGVVQDVRSGVADALTFRTWLRANPTTPAPHESPQLRSRE